jgi:hypothetical protein
MMLLTFYGNKTMPYACLRMMEKTEEDEKVLMIKVVDDR